MEPFAAGIAFGILAVMVCVLFFFNTALVRPEGLEPPTTWFEARYSVQLSYGRKKS